LDTVLGKSFIHEALFYADEEEFLESAVPFVRDGVEAGEAVLVAVDEGKIAALKSQLGEAREAVEFVNMRSAGRNPARIIPIWQEFLDSNAGAVRGIGEPVWNGRSDAELIECHHHEMLLNTAFGGAEGFTLLCPYDVSALDEVVLERVHASHSAVQCDGASETSPIHGHGMASHSPFEGGFPEPPGEAVEVEFGIDDVREVRAGLSSYGEEVGLTSQQVDDLVLAVHEVASNSIVHGGGSGRLRIWIEDGSLVCEVRDRGRFSTDPLVGRVRPAPSAASGRGLWLANRLTDLVQIRSSDFGSAVRLHLRPE
jgi:anti-sigma regulatory factor (Ser/Thr protein kinase)